MLQYNFGTENAENLFQNLKNYLKKTKCDRVCPEETTPVLDLFSHHSTTNTELALFVWQDAESDRRATPCC